jgi:glycine/D-amino acid oxidase-like deaminating enzyme
MTTADVIVIGGGMVGAAIGYGLQQAGASTTILDEDDDALRTARGNFGLVWTQSKGLGLQRYQEWSRESADLWNAFSEEIEQSTGVYTGHEQSGGLMLCLSNDEVSQSETLIADMQAQAGNLSYEAKVIDRQAVEALVPGVRFGDELVGASYCAHDGHANPLRLLRGMHAGFQAMGGRYTSRASVADLRIDGDGYQAITSDGRFFSADKIVIACGHGIPALAAKVGLHCPTRPQRGQILVTERLAPILPMPMGSIRQTDEGSILLGVSHEEVGFDDSGSSDVVGAIAARAARVMPALADVNIVRAWGALRIMPPDGCPIYDESKTWPGVFMATNHSGVTLAAVHARRLPDWILRGETAVGFDAFSVRRFDGTKYARPAQ